MAIIDSIIPSQSFEVVRDKIGFILIDEVANQFTLTSNQDINATVFIERFVPFAKTELPAINVMLAPSSIDGQTAIQSDGTYVFNIDVYHSAKTTDDDDGDKLANFRLQKLLGICRAILENPKYKTLGFATPFIMNRMVTNIAIAAPASGDAVSVVMGRLTFTVRVPENVDLISPELIAGFDTQVKLELSEKGYVFSGNAIPPAPPISGGYGCDLLINNVFFGFIAEGDTLNVAVYNGNDVPVGDKEGGIWRIPPAVVKNSNDTYQKNIEADETFILPNIEIKKSDASVIAIIPSVKDYTVADSNVQNSDSTYNVNVLATDSLVLPDVTITDSDGTPVVIPSVKNFTCIAQVKSTFINFVFGVGATADYTTTIVAGEEGTYTTESLTNITAVVYRKNAGIVTLPFTLIATDTLRITGTITNIALEARVKITGTYT